MFFPPPIEDLHRIYQPFLFSSFLSSLLFSAVDFLFVTSIPENPWNLTKVSVNLVKKKKENPSINQSHYSDPPNRRRHHDEKASDR